MSAVDVCAVCRCRPVPPTRSVCEACVPSVPDTTLTEADRLRAESATLTADVDALRRANAELHAEVEALRREAGRERDAAVAGLAALRAAFAKLDESPTAWAGMCEDNDRLTAERDIARARVAALERHAGAADALDAVLAAAAVFEALAAGLTPGTPDTPVLGWYYPPELWPHHPSKADLRRLAGACAAGRRALAQGEGTPGE